MQEQRIIPWHNVIQQRRHLQQFTKTQKVEDLINILKQINEKLKKYRLAYLIFLYIHQFFTKLSKSLKNIGKSILEQICPITVQLFQTTKSLSNKFYEHIFSKLDKQFYESEIAKKIKQDQNIKPQEVDKNIQEVFNKLLNFQLHQDSIRSVKIMLSKIEAYILQGNNQNIYEQIMINWFRAKLELINSKIHKYTQIPICCHLLWTQEQDFVIEQSLNLDFRKYIWPISNNIELAIRKLLISFLNGQGGIIFIGAHVVQRFSENNQIFNKVKIIGIQLSINQLSDFFHKIKNMVMGQILPKHEGFPSPKKQQKQQFFIKSQAKLPINDYIEMEFIPLTDKTDWVNIRNKLNEKILYMVKIYVKKGHPRHLYHFINQDMNLDFYKRFYKQSNEKNDKIKLMISVSKMKVPDGLDELAKRIKQYKNNIQQYRNMNNKDRMGFHEGCLFDMNNVKIFKVKDEYNTQSTQSDDQQSQYQSDSSSSDY